MTLQRLTGKVFAGNADLTDLGVFGSALSGTPTNPTGTNTEAQIQADAAYEEGWTDAVVTTKNFPPIEEVNGVLRTISYQICYLLQEGIPVWDTNTEYSNTSVVKVINGQQLDFYISQQTQSGNIPQSDDGINWKKAIITGDREIGVPQITLDFNMVLPDGYIELKGQAVSIAQYNNLYAIYGTTYNIGDEDSGYFRLPNFRNRAIYGGASGGYINAGLPNLRLETVANGSHTHSGTTNDESAHTHGKGTYRIAGRIGVIVDSTATPTAPFYKSGTASTLENSQGSPDPIVFMDTNRGGWSGNRGSGTAHNHTFTTGTSGSHTHSIISNQPLVGTSSTVLTDGIKVRVFTRYK